MAISRIYCAFFENNYILYLKKYELILLNIYLIIYLITSIIAKKVMII